MILRCSLLLLTIALYAAEADPLAAALKAPDGDPFAADKVQEALMVAPRAQRAQLTKRIADSGRADVHGILHRLVQDDDPASAEIAIDALAKRWPTGMEDVEIIRMLISRDGKVGGAACRYAAAVGDDEALPALVDRINRSPKDADAEAALRHMLAMPNGCGQDGWAALIEARQAEQEAAISGAERLLGGSPADAMGAVTLIAGLRPAGSRAARVLLAAAEHPDRTVRRMAMSILSTCDAPPAAAWRNRKVVADETALAAQGGGAVVQGGTSPVASTAGPAGAVAVVAYHPAVAVAPVASASGSSWGWVVWLSAIAVIGGGGWLLVQRMRHAAPPPTRQQGRFTWVE